MTFEEVWIELGLDGPSDHDAVRRGYARRLKQTNPEDDPEAFKSLRLAYDVALAYLNGELSPSAEPEECPTKPPAQEADLAQQERQERAQRASTDDALGQARPDPAAEHWNRSNALVERIDRGADAAVLTGDLADLLRAPMMDNLMVYQQTAAGMARALLQLSPKSDPLIDPFLDYFGWRGDKLDYDTPQEVLHLQARSHVLGLRSDFRASHREAYGLLTTAPPLRKNKATAKQGQRVRLLLDLARRGEPWALEEFRPESVKWWEKHGKKHGQGGGVDPRLLFGALFAAASLAHMLSSATPPQTSTRTPSPAGEYAPLLSAREGLAEFADRHPQDSAAWAALCAATARDFWRDQSLADCNHAVALQPGSARVLLDRAYLNLKVGKPDVTIADASEVLEQIPDEPRALFARSLARASKEDLTGGRKDWCRALRLSPNVKLEIEYAYKFQVSGSYAECQGG